MADDVSPFPFATAAELRARWPDMPPGADGHAEVLLEDASQFILDVCPTAAGVAAPTRRRVVCAVVRRSMESALPPGVEQHTQAAGPFSQGFTASNPSGDFYLTKNERKALGEGEQRAFTVEVGGPVRLEHRLWCSVMWGAPCSCGADLTLEGPLWEA